MKINPVSVSFGKQLAAKCTIKNDSNELRHASIYEYKPGDMGDMIELENAEVTNTIKRDFRKHSLNKPKMIYRYFAMCDDKTGEIIACTELSRRYVVSGKYTGYSLSVDELETSGNYKDILAPMSGFLSYKAKDLCCENVYTAFRTEDMPELRQYGFRETSIDTYVLRKRNFDDPIFKARETNNLDIIF